MAKKKLTVQAMKKMDTAFDERKEVSILGYTVTIDKKFRDTKMQAMLTEIMKDIEQIREQKIELDVFSLFALNMIKQFTDVNIPDDLEGKIKVLYVMIDNGILLPLYQAFDEEEVDRLTNKMEQVKNANKSFVDSLLKQQEEAEKEAKENLEQEG